MMNNSNEDRLGVLTVGLGAVATTFMSGVFASARGLGRTVGSLSEMGYMPEKTKAARRKISDTLPTVGLDKMVFGAWDIFSDNAYDMAMKSGVLEKDLLNQVHDSLMSIKPMPAVFDENFVKYLDGQHRKVTTTKMESVELIREDIRNFKKENNCDRLVIVWCASTEAYVQLGEEHQTLKAFEQALVANHPNISPSMIYTYAAILEGVPYANGAPNISVEVPALQTLAEERNVPLTGSDFKTGQTLMKTIVAPGLKSRLLGIDGWFSTNILGNRDGEVLQNPESFKSKEVSKLGVLDSILEPELHPDLYEDLDHAVRINYYKPRGDNKEGWDNIDIHGWLGYPMQIKVNFLCKDSILAAPLVLDLVQFLDLAQRSGEKGIQKWLGFFWKSPVPQNGEKVVHALHDQETELFNQLWKFEEFFSGKKVEAQTISTNAAKKNSCSDQVSLH